MAVSLLRPSPVFAAYAVAPWLVLAALYGPVDRRPWRWSALFGLGVLLVVEHELPAAAYLAVFVAVVVAFQLLGTSGPGLGTLARWWPVTALVTAVLCARVIVLLALSRSGLTTRLALTESPEVPAAASSFSEVARGMGHWLDYFTFGAAPRPHLAPLLESPLVVSASFVLVLVAVGRSLLGGGQQRLLFGMLICVGVVASVGLHPLDDPTPSTLVASWVLTLVEADLVQSLAYATDRPWAARLAQWAIALLSGALLGLGWRERRLAVGAEPEDPAAQIWSR